MSDKRPYLTLQRTEGFVTQAAANIYAAYISAGKVVDGEESQWMKKSIKEAITIAKTTDETIVSEGEMD